MKAAIILALCFFFSSTCMQQAAAADAGQTKFRLFWPPVLNNYYPDAEMQTLSGKKVKLSQYAGKVILIEPIGMSCPACQAFAGAGAKGGFSGVAPQEGLQSIDALLSQNGISPQDPRLVRIQILLY